MACASMRTPGVTPRRQQHCCAHAVQNICHLAPRGYGLASEHVSLHSFRCLVAKIPNPENPHSDHFSWSVAFSAPSDDYRSLPREYCQGRFPSQRKMSPFSLLSWLIPEIFVAPGAVEPARRCSPAACFQCVDHDPTPTLLRCSFLLTITTMPFHP